MPLDEQALNFLKYDFAESKDLAKHFLTVVTAVLVFSLTFAEKVAGFRAARKSLRLTLTASWCTMLLAVLCSGISICYMLLAAEAARYHGGPDLYYPKMELASSWLFAAGTLFASGLVGLIGTAVLSLLPEAPASAPVAAAEQAPVPAAHASSS